MVPPSPAAADAPATLSFHVDQPGDWSDLSRCVIVRGWCFHRASLIQGVRLRAGELTLAGVIGFPRPDVSATLPEAPGANTGFEIRGTLPPGHMQVVIEVQLADGHWLSLLERTTTVRRQWLPLWLRGDNWQELMFFQAPTHMTHAPRPVTVERLPSSAPAQSKPKLSIVTPSFQQAKFLPETMASVLDQGVPVEYVVQDGGSTDGSAEVIRRHAGRLHAWESAPDRGQTDAIVRGFARTSGGPDDLMAWINSDDYYQPGALAFVADYFARHPAVDVIYGHRIVVNENSHEVARWFLPKHDPAVLQLNDFVPQETMFWRRRIWDKAGGVDPAFRFAMDWDLLLRFQAAGAKIVRVPYFLACFRVHSAQKTTAQMHSVGQAEITRLRERTFGRPFPPAELEANPRLLSYLRRSAFIEFLWRRLGLRAP